MTRPSPSAGMVAALGAKTLPVCGVQVPERFGDPVEEHLSVRRAAGLFDLSHRGVIQISGPDRVSWFKGQCTNEVLALSPGQGNHTCIVTRLGKLVTDAILSVGEQDLWLELNADRVSATIAHLETYHVSEKVEVKDRTDDFAVLGLHGPLAPRVLGAIGQQEVPDAPPYHFAEKQIAGVTVRVQRHDLTGEVGFTIVLPAVVAGPAFAMLTQFGQGHGLRPAGWTALQTLRIEAGVPFFGQDAGGQQLPLEAGLAHTISYTKGCYLGQEVIARVSTLGEASRALVGLNVAGERVPEPGDPLIGAGEVEAGKVTSAARSPSCGSVIALALVRKEFKVPGTELSVRPSTGGEPAVAHVSAVPFYRRPASGAQ